MNCLNTNITGYPYPFSDWGAVCVPFYGVSMEHNIDKSFVKKQTVCLKSYPPYSYNTVPQRAHRWGQWWWVWCADPWLSLCSLLHPQQRQRCRGGTQAENNKIVTMVKWCGIITAQQVSPNTCTHNKQSVSSTRIKLMAQRKTAVSPLLTHWRYCTNEPSRYEESLVSSRVWGLSQYKDVVLPV